MKKTLFTIFLLLLFFQSFGQVTNKNMKNVTWDKGSKVVYCSDFNITKPLIEIAKEHTFLENNTPLMQYPDKAGRPIQTFEFSKENDGSAYGCDSSIIQDKLGDKAIKSNRAPLQNWAGQTASGFRPFDPSGAVGPNHYIQMINSTTYRIYNKTGSVLVTGTFGDLWSPATGNAGDPIVLYDKAADRWFMSQFGTSSDKKIYIAISQTNDPTGSWYTYTFTSPDFPDYLKFSAWQDGYYMTANYAQKIFAFNRTKMLAGDGTAEAVYQSFSPPQNGFFVPLPADASDGTMPGSGTACPIFSYSDNGWGGGNIDAVNIYNATVNWSSLTMNVASAGSLATNAFDGSYDPNWDDIPQPGTSQKLDGIGGAMMYRAQWKTWAGYNTTVLSWAVKVSSSQRGIFWCELRQNQSTGNWSIYQQGIYAPGTDYYWMSSIAMNDAGDIALCYAKGSSSTYMSLAYTGRNASDPLGSMTVAEEIAFAGSGSQTGMNRVGDYAQTCLDSDGTTFWHTGEYMGSGGNAGTRVYSFQLPTGSSGSAPVANFSADNTTPTTAQTVTFTDSSSNTPTSWSWSFSPNTLTYVGGTSATSQNPQVSFDASGVYAVTLISTNTYGSDDEVKSNYINVSTAGITYCASKGNSVSDEYIQKVELNTINNPSGATSGYTDHTSISTNLTKENSYTITITPKWTGTIYNEAYAVWIDYNHNGDFTDSGELVWSKAASKDTPVSGTFTIPATAIETATRMRVSMKYNGIPTSCETFSYGEVEDYTINIIPNTADTEAPTAPTNLTASNISQTSLDLTWTASTDNVGVTEYDVYQNSSYINSTSGTALNVSGLTANTTYQYTVKAKDAAGNISNASNIASATTLSNSSSGCSGEITSYPYNQGFENNLGSWTQATGDDFDWTFRSGSTPSSNTGPSSATEGSYYIYMESSYPNYSNKRAILNSPCFDLSGLSTATLAFEYHMYGSSSMGSLALEVSTNNGVTWSTIWSKSGNQGNSWQTASLNLASYVGATVQFRFNGITGTTWQGDMAVDALSISGGGSGGSCENTTFSITFDNYPEETSWNIKDDNGTVVFSGGTYGSEPDGSTKTIPICIDPGCYTFTIYDSYGDGICCGYGNGSYSYTQDYDGSILASGGSFTSSEATNFCISAHSSSVYNGTHVAIADIILYPIPVKNNLNVSLKDKKMETYKITNMMGQIVIVGKLTQATIDLSKLNAGVYTIEFNSDKKVLSRKFIKQ